MLFDSLCGERRGGNLPAVPAGADGIVDGGVLGYWEEHCTECGQPACFGRCPRFVRAPDGKCRRFAEGIVPIRLKDGTRGASVTFLPWGKLEMPWRGATVSRDRVRMLNFLDALFVPMARGLRVMTPWLPWNRNPISIYRGLRTRLLLVWGRRSPSPRAMAWRGCVWAERPTALTASVFRGGHDVWMAAVRLNAGWNTFALRVPLPERSDDDDILFRLFPADGEGTGELLFTRLAIVPSAAGADRSLPFLREGRQRAADASVACATESCRLLGAAHDERRSEVTATSFTPGDSKFTTTDAVGSCTTKPQASCTTSPRRVVREPSVPARFVKLVIWDLDNTVWDGILAENGPEGIRLRPDVVRTLKALDARGILHSAASKNDSEPALAALERFGLADYFLAPQIGWGPKSAMIRAVAEDLGLGLDSVAFVDDAAWERGEVAAALPAVRVYRESDAARLPERPEFSPPLSAESGRRRESYRAELVRRGRQAAFGTNLDAFLRDCGLRLELFRPEDETAIVRCRELVQRTNRLTLAGRRYDEGAFAALLASSEAWAVKCRDRFGDYGTVGFLAVRVSDASAELAEFVMSCRVAGKRCEERLLVWLAERTADRGCRALVADAVDTGRNGALLAALGALPFVVTREGNRVRHLLALPARDLPRVPVALEVRCAR